MSQDGRNWARIEGEHHTGALFEVGKPGEWDETFIAGPQVRHPMASMGQMGSRRKLPQSSAESVFVIVLLSCSMVDDLCCGASLLVAIIIGAGCHACCISWILGRAPAWPHHSIPKKQSASSRPAKTLFRSRLKTAPGEFCRIQDPL